MCYVLSVTFDISFVMWNVWRVKCVKWCVKCDVWCVMYDVWCVMCDVWRVSNDFASLHSLQKVAMRAEETSRRPGRAKVIKVSLLPMQACVCATCSAFLFYSSSSSSSSYSSSSSFSSSSSSSCFIPTVAEISREGPPKLAQRQDCVPFRLSFSQQKNSKSARSWHWGASQGYAGVERRLGVCGLGLVVVFGLIFGLICSDGGCWQGD